MSGRLVAVVGPSGVGKDSLIAGLAAADPTLLVVRRAITRPASDSEPFEPVTEAEFLARRDSGGFVLHWEAHGLRYGIPAGTLEAVRAGRHAVVNLSRGALGEAARLFPSVVALRVSAPPEVLARRLHGRGREDEAAVARRLARPAPPPPPGVRTVEIDNGGALRDAVSAALDALLREPAP
jgi:ribose 1,5-bisphosphokinase